MPLLGHIWNMNTVQTINEQIRDKQCSEHFNLMLNNIRRGDSLDLVYRSTTCPHPQYQYLHSRMYNLQSPEMHSIAVATYHCFPWRGKNHISTFSSNGWRPGTISSIILSMDGIVCILVRFECKGGCFFHCRSCFVFF